MSDCIFCKIASGEIPSYTVYEDDQFRVIMDLSPVSPGHMLILPKGHYQDLYELPEELAAAAMRLAKRLAAAMQEALRPDGLNVMQNNGKAAGQTVMHYHLHLIPCYGDAGNFTLREGQSATQEELEETAAKIQSQLA